MRRPYMNWYNLAVLSRHRNNNALNKPLQRWLSSSSHTSSLYQNGIFTKNLRITTQLLLHRNSSFASITKKSIVPVTSCGTQIQEVRYSTRDHRSRLPEPLEWSYSSGLGEHPLIGMTVGKTLDRAEKLYSDREAVVSVHQGIRKTFAQLNEDATSLAAGLLASGLKPGDRLGIWSPNCYEWIITQFASAKAGLVLVNINPAYRPNELLYCLNKVGVKGIVCARSFKTSDYYDLLCEAAPELPECVPGALQSSSIPNLQTVIFISNETLKGSYQFEEVLAMSTEKYNKTVADLKDKIQFDDAYNIQFTSGTTGLPKGAILSHHNIVNNALNIGKVMKYEEKHHRICVSVPLYHCFGCVAGSQIGALFGATVVLPTDGFSGLASVQALANEEITACYGTPTMYVDILNASRKHDIQPSPALHTGLMGGAPCPRELVEAMVHELRMKDFIVMYGMTETSPVTLACFPEDPVELRCSTVGFPLYHTEVKVVDCEGSIARINDEGELCIRGHCVFKGYWQDEEKTKECFDKDKWFKTGDLASMDETGYVKIKGRKKDVVIRGGEKIFPAELENFFMSHPDIVEAQVFGVPDARMGEEVAAWLKVTDKSSLTDEQFKNWCKGKIAHYKIPRYVLFKDAFPTTVTGKIQKFVMRDQTIKELGLE